MLIVKTLVVNESRTSALKLELGSMVIVKTHVVGLAWDFCSFKFNIQPNSQLACRMS